MADVLRIGVSELLCKAPMEHDAGFLKEGVRGCSPKRAHGDGGRRAPRCEAPQTVDRSQRLPRKGVGHAGWDGGVEGAEDERRRLLSLAVGAEAVRRKGILSTVVQEAYVHRIFTRKFDELVKALGMTGISRANCQ